MWSLIRSPNYWKTKFPGTLFLGSTGTILGTVYQADGVTPQSGAWVTLCPGGPSTWTKTDGTFSMYGIPIGSYRFLAVNPRQTLENFEMIEVERNMTTSVTLNLDQPYVGC